FSTSEARSPRPLPRAYGCFRPRSPMRAPAAKAPAGIDRAYPVVVFLGGFLLFLIQPLLAKAILPWFGGATGVWATALVFYQTVLLAGYAYAHFVTRLEVRRQGWIHLAVLILSLLWLPILPGDAWQPAA